VSDQRDEKGRFREGVSGNRNGRPKRRLPDHGSPFQTNEAIFDILRKEVTVRTRNGTETRTLFQAIFEQQARAAAEGDRQAAKFVTSEMRRGAFENMKWYELVAALKERIAELEAELEVWERRFPQKTHGVLVLPQDTGGRTRSRRSGGPGRSRSGPPLARQRSNEARHEPVEQARRDRRR